jgi:hypothetical protein
MEHIGGILNASGLLHRIVGTFSYMLGDCVTEFRKTSVLTGLLCNFKLTPKNLHLTEASGTSLKRHLFIVIYTMVLGQ